MGIITANKEPSIGEMIAVRLEQRQIPAIGKDSQVFIFENNKRGADVVLSLVSNEASECWGGFWYWASAPNKELLQLEMPSEYRYGINDPLSVEIAFLEWVENNGYFGGTGVFLGKPHEAQSRGLVRVPSNRRYPTRW
jgi:hypothetical protein